MNELHTSITKAFAYLDQNGIKIPTDVLIQARRAGVRVKATNDPEQTQKDYAAAILAALLLFFDGYVIAARNDFTNATVDAFNDMLETAWVDGGGELPVDEETRAWFDQRLDAELAFIALLFIQATQLLNEPEFDTRAWIDQRVTGYTNTLRGIYNNSKMRAMPDIMALFDGDDGKESCPDCQRLKGQRHRVSWFVRHEVVPPFGHGLQCHPGGHCRHSLFDETGRKLTI